VEEAFLTVDEIAELLKVNPQTVRNWLDEGTLKMTRIGPRRVRVRQSELDRFLVAARASERERESPSSSTGARPMTSFENSCGPLPEVRLLPWISPPSPLTWSLLWMLVQAAAKLSLVLDRPD
jgi:excisionase family DNA binding protein